MTKHDFKNITEKCTAHINVGTMHMNVRISYPSYFVAMWVKYNIILSVLLNNVVNTLELYEITPYSHKSFCTPIRRQKINVNL